MTYEFLQQYWWFLVSLLGALLVFLMFVQDLRRSLLRFVPVVLQHQLRRRILGVDAHFAHFCATGCEL